LEVPGVDAFDLVLGERGGLAPGVEEAGVEPGEEL